MKLCRRYRYKKKQLVRPKLNLTKEAYELIVRTTKDNPKVETGGILMGHDISPLTVNVTHASLPGPKAYHSPTKFVRDTEYCSEILRKHYDNYNIDYVGEWHSHIVPIRKVSSGDITTLYSIMHDPDYNFNAFACIVSLLLDNNEVDLVGYVATKGCIYQVDITVQGND